MKNRSVAHGIAVIGIVLAFISPAHAQTEYVRNFVAAPNHGAITVTGFNNQGQVSGSYNSGSNPSVSIPHAFLWDPKTGFHDLAPQASIRSVSNTRMSDDCHCCALDSDATAMGNAAGMGSGNEVTAPNAFVGNAKSDAETTMEGQGEQCVRVASVTSGQTDGLETTPANFRFHTFQVTPSGKIKELKVEMAEPPSSDALAIGVNNKGEIIGRSGAAVNFVISAGDRPIRYAASDRSTSSLSGLYGVNEIGVVLGMGTDYDSKTGETISGFLILTPHQIPAN